MLPVRPSEYRCEQDAAAVGECGIAFSEDDEEQQADKAEGSECVERARAEMLGRLAVEFVRGDPPCSMCELRLPRVGDKSNPGAEQQ